MEHLRRPFQGFHTIHYRVHRYDDDWCTIESWVEVKEGDFRGRLVESIDELIRELEEIKGWLSSES